MSKIILMGLILLACTQYAFASDDSEQIGEISILDNTDIQHLADQAEIILIGQCTHIYSEWNPGETIISTYASYEVEEEITSTLNSSSVTIKSLGGTVDHISQVALDGPRFEINKRNLLFLAPSDEKHIYQIFGFNQGKFDIETDKGSNRDVVHQKHKLTSGGKLQFNNQKPDSFSKTFSFETDRRNFQSKLFLKDVVKDLKSHKKNYPKKGQK